MSLWGQHVAEDWDTQEYDTELRAQQTYKKQVRKQCRIVKALVVGTNHSLVKTAELTGF